MATGPMQDLHHNPLDSKPTRAHHTHQNLSAKLWEICKEMGIPNYLIYLLRNLCAGQEATVITGHGGQTMGGIMAVMPTSFKRIYAHTVVFGALEPTAGHCQPKPLLETPGRSQAGLFWGRCSLLLATDEHKIFFVPSKTVSPVLWKFCNQIPLASKDKFPGNSQSVCTFPGWKICCVSSNFLNTVLQFVGHLFGGSVVGLMATSSKRTCITCHMTQVC